MYISPNMIIYRHHDNGPIYNTKTSKNGFSSFKSPQHFATLHASKGEF